MPDLILAVTYFSQLDSDTSEAQRMCFSSSCAMLAAFLKPGSIHGQYRQIDDNYLASYVHRYGDSTDNSAQVQALAALGVQARFSTSLDRADLEAQIRAGIPVPCGILHHGPASAPTGGGHWVVVIGLTGDKSGLWVHDPAGELDLVDGGYHITNNGAKRLYSWANFKRRWCVDGPKSGWGIIAKK